jgi:UDP-glucuronate 4-epimerase
MAAMERILVTGAAGFIGYHLSQKLLACGKQVIGLDNLNDYYDVALKCRRLEELRLHANFEFHQLDIGDRPNIEQFFAQNSFNKVAHMAAQAGVRYSIDNPHAYAHSNLIGFLNILEGCRQGKIEHLVYASSSSIYGSNREMPFTVEQSVDHPVSLYAATKKSNELMAHTYSHLYNLPTTGLRFFTVYGPWGRPDMAPMLFAKAIFAGEPIKVFNQGNMRRDFTYVTDIVDGVVLALDHHPQPLPPGSPLTPGNSTVPYRVYNIGNGKPIALLSFIELLEKAIGKAAQKEFMPMQPGDVKETYADISGLQQAVGFKPCTPIEVGIPAFVDWYRGYYHI